MNKKVIITLHVAVWAIMFLSPLTFLNHDEGNSLLRYLMACANPLAMLFVFYVNYLWLFPSYQQPATPLSPEGITCTKRRFWLINLLMVVCLGIALHYWLVFAHHIFRPSPRIARLSEPSVITTVFFILHNVFNLAISASFAFAVRAAMRWEQQEKARSKAEAALAEAELRNLRSQVNPHFLLNTLNNIYALTAIDADRAQNAIQQLSKLLRHLLYDNQELEVDLSDEVQFLENYVNLMKLRLPADVDVQFNYKPPSVPFKIAPLITVSLIENAFKHGISPAKPSFIHISISADDGALPIKDERTAPTLIPRSVTIDIENSNYPKTEKDRSGHGIGLQQVQRRLDLSYPGNYKWTHGPNTNGTTYKSTIIITINPT